MNGEDSSRVATTIPQAIEMTENEDVAMTAKTATTYLQVIEFLWPATTTTSSPYGREKAARLYAHAALLVRPSNSVAHAKLPILTDDAMGSISMTAISNAR
jgi:hypothetical protein